MIETLFSSIPLDTPPTSRNHILEQVSVTIPSIQARGKLILLVTTSPCVLDFKSVKTESDNALEQSGDFSPLEGRNSRSHLSLLLRHGSQDCNFPFRLYFSVRLELRAEETL